MSKRIRNHIRGNVVGYVALFFAISGTALAANTISSTDIINGEVKTPDLDSAAVTGTKIASNSVNSPKILDGGVKSADIDTGQVKTAEILDNDVTSSDVQNEGLTSADLATDSVNATEVADNSIDAGEIVDFGLTNQDIGVEFAQINADGTVANSSGGVTGVHIGAGTYEVDFGHTISGCAYTVTQGEAGVGGAGGAITGVTDRSGNAEATFTTTRDAAGALVDRAFQEVVVC